MGSGIYVFIGVLFVIVFWYIAVSNKLNRAQVKIREAESGIEVALTKRYDVLTKQLDITKAYAKHEVETLTKVIELRKGSTIAEKQQALKDMNEMQAKLNVVAESYPELKSSENFKTLQNSVNDVEEHLQAARRLYNANVSAFNQMCVTFPSSIIAKNKNLEEKPFFEAEEVKKNDVKMEF